MNKRGAFLLAALLPLATTLLVGAGAPAGTAVRDSQGTAAAKSKPCTEETLEDCPAPAWYAPTTSDDGFGLVMQTIHYDDGLRIAWRRSNVYQPPPGEVPQWLRVNVEYRNEGDTILYFTCKGVEDSKLAKEHFVRNGKYIGYVAADRTRCCSQYPDDNFTLGPGRSFTSWAVFHNVPWVGDRIYIEWGPYESTSSALNPYARRL